MSKTAFDHRQKKESYGRFRHPDASRTFLEETQFVSSLEMT